LLENTWADLQRGVDKGIRAAGRERRGQVHLRRKERRLNRTPQCALGKPRSGRGSKTDRLTESGPGRVGRVVTLIRRNRHLNTEGEKRANFEKENE